jgi:hypothetical protein
MALITELRYWELHERLDHASFTDLLSFERNPRVCSLSRKRTPTEVMTRGQLVDCLLLSSHEFEERFGVLDFDDLRTKAAREQKATIEASGRTMVKRQWVEQAQQEVASLLADTDTVPAPRDILAAGRGQVAIRQRFGSVWFLSKPDWVPARETDWGDWIIDVKRTATEDVDDWGAKVASYRYHWQAASQLDAYNTEFPDDQRTRYGWLLITDRDCGLIECNPDDLALGRSEYVAALRRYRETFDSGKWLSPFHSPTSPRMASLPEWYRRRSGSNVTTIRQPETNAGDAYEEAS